MVRILGGASLVFRKATFVSGVYVCSPGHWDRRQRAQKSVATIGSIIFARETLDREGIFPGRILRPTPR